MQAATHFPHDRLPEVFAGFPREQFPSPVCYPVACHPQAWAAGAVPYLLETMLGSVPDAFGHRLHLQRAVLPDFVSRVTLRRLKVGNAYCSLLAQWGLAIATYLTLFQVVLLPTVWDPFFEMGSRTVLPVAQPSVGRRQSMG